MHSKQFLEAIITCCKTGFFAMFSGFFADYFVNGSGKTGFRTFANTFNQSVDRAGDCTLQE